MAAHHGGAGVSMAVSRKLIEGADDGGQALYVVEGNPEQGYDLFRVRLEHVAHHRRSWQAVAQAQEDLP